MVNWKVDLQFSNSRNGQLTCSADGHYVHSSFNPLIEAERFVNSISCTYEPSAIFVAGACLSYCFTPLKNRFVNAQLLAVQFDTRFNQYSSEWDKVFYITDENDARSFSSSFFNLLGEEKLMTTLFVSWKPSETIWPQENMLFWEAVKKSMETAQSVLTTRQFFNIRWFKNTIKNLTRIKSFVIPQKTDYPIIVTASGPSLESVLPFLKANRKAYCLMAASSSISTLLANDIVPDFCISTDGGWYATRHLRCYQTDQRLKNIPLIISGESAVPYVLFDSVPFILLSYGDGVETVLFNHLQIPAVKGLRNGTVSGTAAALAASLTTDKVYICGLDLASGKGFQHAEPNENDVPLFTAQSRLSTLETAQARSRFNSDSLAIYREWFSTQSSAFTSRIFRLVSSKDTLCPLGTMKDVTTETLSLQKNGASMSFATIHSEKACNGEKIHNYLKSVINLIQKQPEDKNNFLWFSTLAIKSYISWLRMKPEDKDSGLTSLVHETVCGLEGVLEHV